MQAQLFFLLSEGHGEKIVTDGFVAYLKTGQSRVATVLSSIAAVIQISRVRYKIDSLI